MPPTCGCLCHRADHGKFRAAFHAGNWQKALAISDNQHFEQPASVLADDPLEAAVACSACLAKHCPALLDVKPTPRRRIPPRPYSPDSTGEGGE